MIQKHDGKSCGDLGKDLEGIVSRKNFGNSPPAENFPRPGGDSEGKKIWRRKALFRTKYGPLDLAQKKVRFLRGAGKNPCLPGKQKKQQKKKSPPGQNQVQDLF